MSGMPLAENGLPVAPLPRALESIDSFTKSVWNTLAQSKRQWRNTGPYAAWNKWVFQHWWVGLSWNAKSTWSPKASLANANPGSVGDVAPLWWIWKTPRTTCAVEMLNVRPFGRASCRWCWLLCFISFFVCRKGLMFVTSHILGSGINWKWAYTPFMNQVKAGQDPDMQGWLGGHFRPQSKGHFRPQGHFRPSGVTFAPTERVTCAPSILAIRKQDMRRVTNDIRRQVWEGWEDGLGQ